MKKVSIFETEFLTSDSFFLTFVFYLGRKSRDVYGWKIMIGTDHSVLEDCLWGETKWDEEFDFAIPRTFVPIQGEEIVRTAEELTEVQKHYKSAGQ